MRKPLDIQPGDYAYVYYPNKDKLPKLHPRAFGPFPVKAVDYHWGTGQPSGVTLDLGMKCCPVSTLQLSVCIRKLINSPDAY